MKPLIICLQHLDLGRLEIHGCTSNIYIYLNKNPLIDQIQLQFIFLKMSPIVTEKVSIGQSWILGFRCLGLIE